MRFTTHPLPYILQARRTIQSLALPTPLIQSEGLTERTGTPCYLKLEIQQPTHSFKIRGAANKIRSLSPEERARGIIAVSTGNHGRAVAYIAKKLGIPATVCLSERVPANKVNSLRQLGVTLVIHGQSQDEAERQALRLIEEHGYTLIHPFDDADIIAGQGTLGLEIVESLPDVDTVLVPLSGGGLISGVALALKAVNPHIRVVGVSMAGACVMYHSLQHGAPIEMPEADTLADSLLGGIGLDNRHTFAIVRDYVDAVLLVSEDEIAQAMAFALHEHHAVVEGAGAVGIAALLNGHIKPTGAVACVISGGNVDIPTLLTIAQGYKR